MISRLRKSKHMILQNIVILNPKEHNDDHVLYLFI